MQSVRIQGVVANLVTPFEKGGATVDQPALEQLVERLIERGVQGITALGQPGEARLLSETEWQRAAEIVTRQSADRVPVVIDVSAETTAEAETRARLAEACGAHMAMLAPLSDATAGRTAIFEHFTSVAEAVSLPLMVRNDPRWTGVDLAPELLIELANTLENGTMVFECSGELERQHELFAATDGRLPFLNGADTLVLASFAAGATGWCTAVAHWIPELAVELWEASFRSDLYEARELFYRQLPLLDFLESEGASPAAIKFGLRTLGFDFGESNASESLDDERAAVLAKRLARCGMTSDARPEAA